MSSLVLTTKPTSEPVSVEDVIQHSSINLTDEDPYLLNMIKAARENAEGFCNRAFITQTYTMKLDSGFCDMEIPKGKLQSVNSINYIDIDGVNQLLDSSVYTVDTDSDPGRVVLAYNQSWPSTRDVIQNVTIEFTCGYGEVQDVPKEIRQALFSLIDHWYINRSLTTEMRLAETPRGYESILWPYRLRLL